MKTVICFALVAAALAQSESHLDPDRPTSNFNANSVEDAEGHVYTGSSEAAGQSDKGRMTGVHSAGCPSHSTLERPPYQDMRDCKCDDGYEAYAWPGWGCYQKTTLYECPANTAAPRISAPKSMNDCNCLEGFAKYEDQCVYAYVFHVHGRVWISGPVFGPDGATSLDETNFLEQPFKNAMAFAVNRSEARYNQKPCPGNFNGTITQEECLAAKDPLTDTLMNCFWSDEDTDYTHLHLNNYNGSQVTAGEFETSSNNAAQCVIEASTPALTRAEKVNASDILPYSVRHVADIKSSLNTLKSDGKIVLAESDSDAKNGARKNENNTVINHADYVGGVTIGFAIRLRGTSMDYGNALVNVMKKPSLATDFRTEYGVTGDVHIFIWALTAEFWRSEPKPTIAPYTWAPKKNYTHTSYVKPASYTAPPTAEREKLSPDHKATVNMALTIACSCDADTVMDSNDFSHIHCLDNHDFLSMYEFVPHEEKFRESVAQILFGAPNASLVEVATVSPAGLHPHDVNTWSPVHSHENANGIEVHFKVAAQEWGNANDWENEDDHGLYNIKKRFDDGFKNDQGVVVPFAQKLATELQQNTLSDPEESNAWKVPKQCILKNINKATGKAVKAYWTMKQWQQPTHPPTPPPTPVPLGTPGRTPNCVGGKTVTIQGHAEILSPAPVSGDATGVERKVSEDEWLQKVRTCMAASLDAHYNESDTSETPLEMCNILVSYGPTCNASEGAELPDLCQECIDGQNDPNLGPQNWDLGGDQDKARCNGLLRYEGEIYQRPETNSTVEHGNQHNATRRLLGKLGEGDPNRPLRVRHEMDGRLTVYRFNFEINSPSADMSRGNGLFAQIQYRKDNTGKSEFVMDVNDCLKAGHVVAPQFENGLTYRPSVPTVSIMAADSLAYHYIEPQATTTTAAPASMQQECKIVWSEPTACSKTCGGGKRFKFGLVTKAAIPHNLNGQGYDMCNGPDDAPGSRTLQLRSEADLRVEYDDCNPDPCPVSCKTDDWNSWGGCSETCGGGVQKRQRVVNDAVIDLYNKTTGECKKDANGDMLLYSTGKGACASATCGDMEQTRTCDNFPCPENCTTTMWGEWGTCSKQCTEDGETAGTQWRRRTITSPAYYGGADCGDLTQSQSCNENACPVNCVVSQWSEWGTCNKNCAGKPAGARLTGARQERTRYIVKAAANGGHECPSLVQTKLCALHPCGAHVCTTQTGFPLTCTYENNIVYTHHVNDVHDDELFMCYHNYVTQVCTCLCWAKATITEGVCHNAVLANNNAATSCSKEGGEYRGVMPETNCTGAHSAQSRTGMNCKWVGNVGRHQGVATGNVNTLNVNV